MVPFAKAESGRPEGARVTESVSTMSTYSSLLVCRTFARRHGTARVSWPILEGLRTLRGRLRLPPVAALREGEELIHVKPGTSGYHEV